LAKERDIVEVENNPPAIMDQAKLAKLQQSVRIGMSTPRDCVMSVMCREDTVKLALSEAL
jgi:hypothetical protein